MERHLNFRSKLSDITYLSELIPAASLCEAKRRGLIHTMTYSHFVFVSHVFIKKEEVLNG